MRVRKVSKDRSSTLFTLDFKVNIKMDHRGDIREYIEESISMALSQVRLT